MRMDRWLFEIMLETIEPGLVRKSPLSQMNFHKQSSLESGSKSQIDSSPNSINCLESHEFCFSLIRPSLSIQREFPVATIIKGNNPIPIEVS